MKATKQLIRWLAVTNRDFHTCGPECNDGTCKVLAQERFESRREADEMDDGLTILQRVVNHDSDCKCHWCAVAGVENPEAWSKLKRSKP